MVTTHDLYNRTPGNWVHGLGSMKNRTGVHSLARYDPDFSSEDVVVMDADLQQALCFRGAKTMCHELCHMFGIKHCVDYACLMNGSNNGVEAYLKPFHLCLICLKKLFVTCRFDPIDRAQAILDACAINPLFSRPAEHYTAFLAESR